MGEAGRQRVLASFTAGRQAEAVAELLAETLRQRAAATLGRAPRFA
jgi:hypothetical protein